ncbi:hypothetical protein ACSBR2_028005 [Camellia fascicularis]
MDDSKNHQNFHEIDEHHGSVRDRSELFGFDCKNYAKSREFLIDMVKYSLLHGAERVLMARKWAVNRCSDPSEDGTEGNSEACKAYEKKYPLLQPSSKRFAFNKEYTDVSKVVNFPLNFLAFLAISVFKLIGFQINLFTSFFTVPIWLFYSTFMFFMFPIQTLIRIRDHLTKRLLRMCGDYYSIRQKSVMNLAMRFGWAFFRLLCVCFMLVVFACVGLVEEPIQTAETLNFDYTKASPVAFVPIMASTGAGIFSGMVSRKSAETMESVGWRAIPYNHKLQLTVSLTMPESEYNRKLGVFQVRVDLLSANGKITASSSYPTMPRFKSPPIRFIKTIFKTAPLLAGFQSETQILNIKSNDFSEGYKPTACLKVTIEPRAEYQSGAGIPQIYAASLALESELPQLKKIIWYWRRTIFVWISLMSFLTELMIVLIFFRLLIMPRGRPRAVGAKMESHRNKISLYRSF